MNFQVNKRRRNFRWSSTKFIFDIRSSHLVDKNYEHCDFADEESCSRRRLSSFIDRCFLAPSSTTLRAHLADVFDFSNWHHCFSHWSDSTSSTGSASSSSDNNIASWFEERQTRKCRRLAHCSYIFSETQNITPAADNAAWEKPKAEQLKLEPLVGLYEHLRALCPFICGLGSPARWLCSWEQVRSRLMLRYDLISTSLRHQT